MPTKEPFAVRLSFLFLSFFFFLFFLFFLFESVCSCSLQISMFKNHALDAKNDHMVTWMQGRWESLADVLLERFEKHRHHSLQSIPFARQAPTVEHLKSLAEEKCPDSEKLERGLELLKEARDCIRWAMIKIMRECTKKVEL